MVPACQMQSLQQKTGVHDPAFSMVTTIYPFTRRGSINGKRTVKGDSFNFWGLPPLCVAMEDVYKMNDVKIGSLAGAFPLSAPPAILLAGALLPKLTMPLGMHNELPLHRLIFDIIFRQPRVTFLVEAKRVELLETSLGLSISCFGYLLGIHFKASWRFRL